MKSKIKKIKNSFISIVFSFFNEEEVLPELIRRLRKVLGKDFKNRYELIFVNDASKDKSLEILLRLSRDHKDIKIINMSRNFGNSVCFLAGMRHAKGDAIIYMDTDLQDPPELIPRMIKMWQEDGKAEVVNTVRRSRLGENPIKMWITKLGYRILKSTSDISLTVNAGDFKLLSRLAVDEVLKIEEEKPFLRGIVSWIGFKQLNLYYQREERFAGKAKYPLFGKRVIYNFLESALISFSDFPLKISFFFGFILTFLSFFFLILSVLAKIFGFSLSFWIVSILFFIFLFGLQFFFLGLMSLYISGIYRSTRNRPNYIIKDLIGFD